MKNQRINSERLILASHEKIDFINPYDIIYCQSDGRSTKLFINNGNIITTIKTIIVLQREFPSILIRANQCTIINKLYIEYIDKKRKMIVLTGQKEIPFTIALRDLLERIRNDWEPIVFQNE